MDLFLYVFFSVADFSSGSSELTGPRSPWLYFLVALSSQLYFWTWVCESNYNFNNNSHISQTWYNGMLLTHATIYLHIKAIAYLQGFSNPVSFLKLNLNFCTLKVDSYVAKTESESRIYWVMRAGFGHRVQCTDIPLVRISLWPQLLNSKRGRNYAKEAGLVSFYPFLVWSSLRPLSTEETPGYLALTDRALWL